MCFFPILLLLAKHDPPLAILAYCYETQTEFHQITRVKTNGFGDGEGCPPDLENFAYLWKILATLAISAAVFVI